MHWQTLVLTLLPIAAAEIKVVLSNDDGWAEINIREFHNSMSQAGLCSFISAPAENQSGTGSSDATPSTVGDDGCEFGSCAAGSPPFGNNASMPLFNNLSTTIFGGPPDIAVAGPNVGANLGFVTQFSGTVGATVEAVKEGIPGIAFSGTTGTQTAWNASVVGYETIYADLSTNVTQTLVRSGKPYLPPNVWLNVNYPASNSTICSRTSDFKFVLSRINAALPIISGDDVTTCNNSGRLPTETDVINTAGCYASISVGHADTKLDATGAEQAAVLQKLQSILSCLSKSP
nr:acid phosphatase [Quercus suber]